MELRLRTYSREGAVIVSVGGEVDLHNAPQLRAELQRTCDVEKSCVVVDLSPVSFIDSSGIGVLVAALKRVRERQGALVLVCPQERIRRVFEITGLLQALPLYATLEEAISTCDAAPDSETAAETAAVSSLAEGGQHGQAPDAN